MSKNFPFESHRKITSLELLVSLVAGDLGGCWELVSTGLFCGSFLGGFSGRSREKEFDVGRLTSSISSSDHWLSFDVGMAALFLVTGSY